MDWNKILKGGTDDLASLIQNHSEGIAKVYDDGDGEHAVDINLKFKIVPVKSNKDAVKIKTGISFTTDRIKEDRERTVDSQGDMFTEDE
jgi:hypothetical protein